MLTLFQTIVFLSYILFLLVIFKQPLESISESYYQLIGYRKRFFLLFCCLLGIPMFFQTDGSTGWFFLSGASLLFVGITSEFKSEDTKTGMIHYLSTSICIISAFLAIGLEKGVWVLGIWWILFSFLMYLLKINKKTWWIEILAFILILIGLLL